MKSLITIPAHFRWLFAILVAFSLTLPHLTLPSATSQAGKTASSWRAVDSSVPDVLQMAGDSGRASESLPNAEGGPVEESFGEGFAGDYSYETDKLLLLFFMRWGRILASWSSAYAVVESPDPVFPFERPPKFSAV